MRGSIVSFIICYQQLSRAYIDMVVERCERTVNKNGNNEDELPGKVEVAIHEIVNKEGFKNYKVLTRAISTVGGNYFGSLYEVDVEGTTADGDKEMNIFVKGAVPGDHFTVLSVTGMFTMESFMYNELSVVFNELQDQAGIPASERYKTVKSYQSMPEAIILENVARKGYKTLYRMDPIPLKYAELSIQQLARLHGMSFVLEKQRPEYFDKKIKSIPCPYNFNDDFKTLIEKSADAISACLDNNAKRRFLDSFPNIMEKVVNYVFNEEYKKTLVHNDYRPNNILMKEIDGEIVDVIPVDYQLFYYGCPLIDFMYFIFLGTDQQFRKDHLDDLKDVYHQSLTKILKYFDIDVDSVFPRKDFEDLYERVLDFGLFSFVQIMTFIFSVDDEVPQLDKSDLSGIVIKTDPRMEERARGVIDDFIRWGVL